MSSTINAAVIQAPDASSLKVSNVIYVISSNKPWFDTTLGHSVDVE